MRSIIAVTLLATLAGVAWLSAASAHEMQAYCAQVKDDDRLQALPANLTAAARKMFEINAEMPDSLVRVATSVRCMDGVVWICDRGANLVCGKADVGRKSPGADKFCKQDPDAIGVPMSATGHATIYDWKCVGGKAVIAGQITKVDSRGFIADNWKRLEERRQ